MLGAPVVARVSAPALVAVALLLIGGCDAAPNADRQPRASAGRFVDNEDGTVTDRSTGLVWERKCDCPESLHHYEGRYRWSADGEHETIWDWLAEVNEEGGDGFAGRDDWRIPNVKELVSLVDYEREDPAVAAELGACEQPCDDPAGAGCACTMPAAYWTSTTFADFPAHARWNVAAR